MRVKGIFVFKNFEFCFFFSGYIVRPVMNLKVSFIPWYESFILFTSNNILSCIFYILSFM